MYFLKYGFSIVFLMKIWYHIKERKQNALHP